MIERHVYIKLTDEHATDEARSEICARVATDFPTIPGVTSVDCGVPADEPARKSWDVFITVRFASIADVEPYRVHPTHVAFLDEAVKPRLAVVKAWNFVVNP